MPKMDGYEVIHAVKKRDETRDIPIVIMTAHQLDAEQIHLIEMTVAQVAKPAEPTSLAEEIAGMLTNEGIIAAPSNLAEEVAAATGSGGSGSGSSIPSPTSP